MRSRTRSGAQRRKVLTHAYSIIAAGHQTRCRVKRAPTLQSPHPVKFIIDNWYLIVAALASGGLLLWPALQGRSGSGSVGTLEATQLINRGATLVDVRSADEFKQGHIAGAKHIPVDQIAARAADVAKNKENPVVVVCASGARSSSACATLRKQGYTQVLNLQGGLNAWRAANLPLTTK